MAEELKGQVGEHIPTVIPLMAQAMGMSVKELFKTMEQGKLDPMTALPKLAELMKNMSAGALADFQKSLPYMQGRALEARQQFMRDFNDSGATSGLTRFWRVWAHINEEVGPMAEKLGKQFEWFAWKFSALLLLPTELKRWMEGETDIRNFWQKYFGDFADTSFLTNFSSNMSELWDNLKILTGAIVDLSTAMGSTLLPVIGEIILFVQSSAVTLNGVIARALSGDISGAQDYYNQRQLIATARAKTADDYQRRGLKPYGKVFENDVQFNINVMRAAEIESAREGDDPVGFWARSGRKLDAQTKELESSGTTFRGLGIGGAAAKWFLDRFQGKHIDPVVEAEEKQFIEDRAKLFREGPSGELRMPSNDPAQVVNPQSSTGIKQEIDSNVTIQINVAGTTAELAEQIKNESMRVFKTQLTSVFEQANSTIPSVSI